MIMIVIVIVAVIMIVPTIMVMGMIVTMVVVVIVAVVMIVALSHGGAAACESWNRGMGCSLRGPIDAFQRVVKTTRETPLRAN